MTRRDVRGLALPILLTASFVGWAAVTVSDHLWLFAVVLAAVGVADLPLVARVRVRRGMPVALLMHAGVLIIGWFVAFLVWAPFVRWE